jgi:glucose/arabinose dehydrogenase
VSIPFNGGKPQDVASGSLNAKPKARGRPVGRGVDKTGGLLIADDVGNTAWRVSAKTP